MLQTVQAAAARAAIRIERGGIPLPDSGEILPSSERSAAMSRLICVDASFVLKLLLDEADSDSKVGRWPVTAWRGRPRRRRWPG
ncbi:MAG: hypothetical protein WBV59_02535 [Anaerolineae bacterium]